MPLLRMALRSDGLRPGKAVLALLIFWLLPALGLAQERPFHFILLSDPQFGMYAENLDFREETANYEFAVATVNRLKPAFVVVLGDLLNKPGDPAQISEYLRISRMVEPAIPVYHVAGNHDVGNEPTPESLASYRKSIGPDYYSFRFGPLYGIVLNSGLLHAPEKALAEYEAQERWLVQELSKAGASGAKPIVVFQHHAYFIKAVDEPDAYANIPAARRLRYLDLLSSREVGQVFAGHHHMNALARYRDMEIVVCGPIGKPLGPEGSGIRVVTVQDGILLHRFYGLGDLPAQLPAKPR